MNSLPFSSAAERNKEPILDVLRRVLPATANVLEIASGSGQHAAHFAAAQARWAWQPSEADPLALPDIDARCAGLANVRPARHLNVLSWPDEGLGPFDAVFCANLLHIAAWSACEGLMRGAGGCLVPGGVLAVYGPFVAEGEPTAPSNLAFDEDLRARNPAWGLRRLGDVRSAARACGLTFVERVAMPANNATLVFRRT